MNKIILFFALIIVQINAIELGTLVINKNENSSNVISKDIQNLLKQYNINLNIKTTNSSYDNIDLLLNNKSDNYFSIVKKDSISNYNKLNNKNLNKSMYNQLPAILALGSSQIHIFKNINNEFDFETRKKYNVYCGDTKSDSCVAASNIQKAYDFEFKYIKLNNENIFEELKNKIDLYFFVARSSQNKHQDIKNISLVDLPTNFPLEEMYINTSISKDDYKFLDDSIHSLSSSSVLITNLKDDKYSKLIQNIVKIIMLNKNYLISKNNKIWTEIDFEYFKFKKFSKISKANIIKLSEQIKQKNALIF